jgi:hypothetical protein
MKLNKQYWAVVLLVFVAFFFSADVFSAATFEYDRSTVTNEQTIAVPTPNNSSGGVEQIVFYDAGANADQHLAAWCLYLYDYLTASGTNNTGPLTTDDSCGSNPFLDAARIGEIGWVVAQGSPLISDHPDVSAAAQLGLWKLEDGAGFTSPGVSVAVDSIAQQSGTNFSAGGGSDCPTCTGTRLSSNEDQNLEDDSQLPVRGAVSTTPLPAALPLFAIGLGALGLLGWRKKRKAQAAV